MSFIFFAWVASVVYGLEVIISKIVSRHLISNLWLFNFLWLFWILVFTLPVAIINGVTLPHSWWKVLAAGIFYALGSLLYIFSLYRLDVSVVAPLYSTRSLFSLILGVYFLKEPLSISQIVLILVTVASSVLVTYEESFNAKSFLNSTIFIAILGIFFNSLMSAFVKEGVAESGYWTVSLLMPFISQVFLLITLPKFAKDLRRVSLRSHLAIMFIAFFGFLGTLSANKAFAGSVSLTTVILSVPFSMVITFVLGSIWPNLLEKHTLKVYGVRFTAAAIMIVCGVKLSLM